MFLSEEVQKSALCVSISGVVQGSWHCTFWFLGVIYGTAVTCSSIVWTVGRLWNLTSNDGGRPIKFLHHGHGPGWKRPTQGLHLCFVVDLEREMPASPCFLAHRGCSVSDNYATMMPDTVSPTADFSIQTRLVSTFFKTPDAWEWLGVSLNPKNFIRIKEHRWRMTDVVLLNAAEQVIFIAEVCSWSHMHTHSFKAWDLGLFVFWLDVIVSKKQSCLDLVWGCTWIETSCGLTSFHEQFSPVCLARDWDIILPRLQDR